MPTFYLHNDSIIFCTQVVTSCCRVPTGRYTSYKPITAAVDQVRVSDRVQTDGALDLKLFWDTFDELTSVSTSDRTKGGHFLVYTLRNVLSLCLSLPYRKKKLSTVTLYTVHNGG